MPLSEFGNSLLYGGCFTNGSAALLTRTTESNRKIHYPTNTMPSREIVVRFYANKSVPFEWDIVQAGGGYAPSKK